MMPKKRLYYVPTSQPFTRSNVPYSFTATSVTAKDLPLFPYDPQQRRDPRPLTQPHSIRHFAAADWAVLVWSLCRRRYNFTRSFGWTISFRWWYLRNLVCTRIWCDDIAIILGEYLGWYIFRVFFRGCSTITIASFLLINDWFWWSCSLRLARNTGRCWDGVVLCFGILLIMICFYLVQD